MIIVAGGTELGGKAISRPQRNLGRVEYGTKSNKKKPHLLYIRSKKKKSQKQQQKHLSEE